ncbi:hypothetical protein [Deinococcus cellulosilyticus]|uniref:Uncharacterized protein n=1 Tax=Deinococcus cellulosilyticus (strain DSM 18568 / NBRC 106333 / KACC 11606 / 5516J-15) TaxID=1223518 RepID=A0A511N3U8_DEIC1|nr:hypothetical protein [Deinococcus cellulosilyticus]GEM47051.1 hypothetical protein DC3_26860 [Deinococcus cellulosilyticus NBRC 106333 = KACC 11606]
MRLVEQLRAAKGKPSREQALPILRTVYLLAFLVLIVPIALLGVLFLRHTWEPLYFWIWMGLSVVLSGAVLGMAGRAYQEEASFKSALTVAIRLGSAPAVPALFAALNYSNVVYLLAFMGLSAVFYLMGALALRNYAGPYQR